MTTPQKYLLQSLASKGWPAELLSYCLERCNATASDWQSLVTDKLVALQRDRWQLTPTGKRAYREAKTHANF